jgi:hypothetical protein
MLLIEIKILSILSYYLSSDLHVFVFIETVTTVRNEQVLFSDCN